MAEVRLDFVPPQDPDIAALRIFEAAISEGPFQEIERATNIGVYPSYISYYVTDQATSASNWFAIRWENLEGIVGDMSSPIQGGTGTVVHEILNRVKLRSSALPEAIIVQSAEFVISEVMGTDNPYDPNLNPTYRQMEGMTLLTLARSGIQLIGAAGSDSGWTAGLVSMKSGTGTTSKDNLEWLMAEAARVLGLPTARIAQMATMVIAGGLSAYEIGTAEPILIAVE
jgi:uncharacterized protein YraI